MEISQNILLLDMDFILCLIEVIHDYRREAAFPFKP